MISFQRTIASFVIGVGLTCSGCNQTTDATTRRTPAESQTPPYSTSGESPSTSEQSPALREPDVVYVPTPPEVVERMLAIANVNQNDVLYDLGSGDGRIPITAVQKYGVRRAVGIDINPQRIQEANANAKQAGVTDRVRFLNQDLFQSDFSDATVVTLYLLSSLNLKLRPQLFNQLEPGTRVVSHAFDMGDWEPERTEKVEVDGQTYTIYFWTIPESPPTSLQSSISKHRLNKIEQLSSPKSVINT